MEAVSILIQTLEQQARHEYFILTRELLGGLCGSVFIDDAFEKCIKTLVGEQEYESIKVERRLKMMERFETSVKRHYSGDEGMQA